MSGGCGGPTLMLANLHRMPRKLPALGGRGVNVFIRKM